MSIKKEDCSLFFISENKISELLIKDLLNSEERIRLCLDDIKSTKKTYFDVVEKLDAIYYLNNESTMEEIRENLDDFIQIKNGTYARNIVFISKYNEELSKVTASNEYTSDLKFLEKNIRIVQCLREIMKKYSLGPEKIVFVNLFENTDDILSRHNLQKNMLKTLYSYFSFRVYVTKILEKLIKESGLDYRIIRINRFQLNLEMELDNNYSTKNNKDDFNNENFEQIKQDYNNKLLTVKNLNELILNSLEKKSHPYHKKELVINNYQDYLFSKIFNSFFSFIFMREKKDKNSFDILFDNKPIFNLHKQFNENINVFSYPTIHHNLNTKEDFYLPNCKVNRELIKFSFYTGVAFSMTAMLIKKLI
jgi:hypothetical protein